MMYIVEILESKYFVLLRINELEIIFLPKNISWFSVSGRLSGEDIFVLFFAMLGIELGAWQKMY
jgi:hypothetical protein